MDRAIESTPTAEMREELSSAGVELPTEEEQVQLTLMINVINGWNRLAVRFGLWVDPAAAKAAAKATV